MESKQIDRYQAALQEATKELKECQKKKNVKSCLQCELVIGCAIRKNYVCCVYDSMNKGQGGGFEF